MEFICQSKVNTQVAVFFAAAAAGAGSAQFLRDFLRVVTISSVASSKSQKEMTALSSANVW